MASRRDAFARRLVPLALGALLVGCAGGSDDRPGALLDGTSAQAAPVAFEGIKGATVFTSFNVIPLESIEANAAAESCLHDRFGELDAVNSAVVRTGVESESVTFEEASGQAIFGCSNSSGPREANRRWCGSAYGQLYSGRLRDPRLSILCRTTAGAQVGFVWVEAADNVRYLAVEQPDYVEVYEVAADLPVRIATVSGVDIDTSSATFDISEHDAEGKRLREYELEAFVAG